MSEVVYLYREILLEVNCLHQEIHTTSVPAYKQQKNIVSNFVDISIVQLLKHVSMFH